MYNAYAKMFHNLPGNCVYVRRAVLVLCVLQNDWHLSAFREKNYTYGFLLSMHKRFLREHTPRTTYDGKNPIVPLIAMMFVDVVV